MKRFLSLDIFRGLTVACMIMVNNPGNWKNVFAPLRHQPWDGCTPTDLVFPFFLFIVGAAVWFSMRRTNQELTKPVVARVIKRGVLIFLVGTLLGLYSSYDFQAWEFKPFENLRILGVLQRIGLAFIGGSILALWLKTNKRIIIGTAVLLVAYWFIMIIFGDLTLDGNAVLFVDRAILGESHLYQGYGIPFEPEGLLSTIPSFGNLLIGYMTARLIGESKDGLLSSITQMAAYGGLLVVGGLIWDGVFPLNKPIWSSSYIIYSCGLAMIVWAVISYFVDYKEKTKYVNWLNVFGTNALFAYALSQFLAKTFRLPFFLFSVGETKTALPGHLYNFYSSITTTHIGSLMWALTMVAICWIITYPLYRKKIFIKL